MPDKIIRGLEDATKVTKGDRVTAESREGGLLKIEHARLKASGMRRPQPLTPNEM